MSANRLLFGDNLEHLATLPGGSFQLIYIDPPFNTGREQVRTTRRSERSAAGRLGFKGQSYSQIVERVLSYDDQFADYWAFLEPRLEQAWRLLHDTGTLYLHLDYR